MRGSEVVDEILIWAALSIKKKLHAYMTWPHVPAYLRMQKAFGNMGPPYRCVCVWPTLCLAQTRYVVLLIAREYLALPIQIAEN